MTELANRVWVQPRPSRRRLLQQAGLGGASLALAAAIGCSSGHKPAGGAQTAAKASNQAGGQPKRGGVLNYAGGTAGSHDTFGGGYDPHTQSGFTARNFGLFYERLLAYNLRTYALEPELAQKWEQPSPTEYLFHLQPGVKWHNKPPANGRPLTADDVVWSLERARTNDPRFMSRSLLAVVDKIDAPDEATVRVTMKAADASTLTKLSADNLVMLAQEVVDRFPKINTADAAVGTGAFIVKSKEDNVGAEYVRNPDYWKPGLPYLDGLRTRHFGDYQTAWAAFLAGQVDVALVPGQEIKNYIAEQGQGYTPDWYADDTLGALQTPNVRVKPLNDARVTHALRLLTDHDELITAWAEVQTGKGGYGSLFPSAFSAWDLTPDEYRQHPEWKQPKDDAAKEAISLLSAAGYTKDNPLKFMLGADTSPQNATTIQLLQAQWKRWSQGAVDVQTRFYSGTTRLELEASGQFTYDCVGVSVGMVEPDIWLTSFYRTGGSVNRMGFSDPQADALIDKQRASFNATERKSIIKQILLYMIDHGPSTIAANRYFLYGVKPKVQNRKPEYFLNGHQYESVWLSG